MIKAFLLDGKPVHLVPNEIFRNPKLNIFSADSMTLLVGPNGGGKTETLAALANLVLHSENRDMIDWEENGQAESTHVIYYTAIPYQGQRARSSSRYHYIKPRHGTIQPDLEISTSLADTFEFDSRPTLTFSKKYSDVVSNILRAVLRAATRNGSAPPKISDDWLRPFVETEQKSFKEYLNGRTQAVLEGDTQRSKYDSTDWDLYTKNQELLYAELETQLTQRIGPLLPLMLRACHYAMSFRKSSAMVLEVLRKLGFTVTEKGSSRKTEERYSIALHWLRNVSEIIKNETLKNRSYRINPNQWEALSKTAMPDMATLSNNGFSSGTFALLEQFACLKNQVDSIKKLPNAKNLLLLIDEGDAFLHIEWQQR